MVGHRTVTRAISSTMLGKCSACLQSIITGNVLHTSHAYLKTTDTFHCRALARVKFSERGKFFFMPFGYVRFDAIKAIKVQSHFTGKAVFSL